MGVDRGDDDVVGETPVCFWMRVLALAVSQIGISIVQADESDRALAIVEDDRLDEKRIVDVIGNPVFKMVRDGDRDSGLC